MSKIKKIEIRPDPDGKWGLFIDTGGGMVPLLEDPTLQILAIVSRTEVHMGQVEDKLSEIEGKLNTLTTNLDTAEAKIAEDVADFQRQITDLKAQVANQGATPEVLARFDAISSGLDTFNNRVGAIDPDPAFPTQTQ